MNHENTDYSLKVVVMLCLLLLLFQQMLLAIITLTERIQFKKYTRKLSYKKNVSYNFIISI